MSEPQGRTWADAVRDTDRLTRAEERGMSMTEDMKDVKSDLRELRSEVQSELREMKKEISEVKAALLRISAGLGLAGSVADWIKVGVGGGIVALVTWVFHFWGSK